jgi:hypothetical protein
MYITDVFYFESIEQDVELEFHVTVERDGIGGYEYGGARYFDEGNITAEVDGMEWDKTLFTDEENTKIQAEYDARQKEIEEKIINEALKED